MWKLITRYDENYVTGIHTVKLKYFTNDQLYNVPKALKWPKVSQVVPKTTKTSKVKPTAGEFLHPFTKEKIPPPIAPIANAPPQSSTIR